MARPKTTPGSRSRPILRKAVLRERLFKQLDRFQEGPVIWVSGPGGCGKTTLISSYLQERGLPSLWYQVEEADKDLATFFYHLGAAFKAAFPKRKKNLPLLTSEYLQGIPIFARRFFKEAFAQLKPGMMLVLDNFQLIPEDSRVLEILRVGVDEIPPGNPLALISRKGPSPDWIRLRANRQLGLLTWEDLRLTMEEVSQIVRLRADREFSPDTILSLYEASNGWAAGLMLMIEGVRQGIDIQAFEETHREGIVAYFGNEIFEKITPERQDFLMQTALLPQMTVTMAEALTGAQDAGARFSSLRRENYFLEQRYEREPIYQYHPLFREFLLSRAERSMEPGKLLLLSSRAATLLEESGQLEAAAALYRKRGDWWGLVGIIMRQARGLLDQSRFGLVEEWLEALPADILESSPWLLFFTGACRVIDRPRGSRPYFERSFNLFQNQDDSVGQFLSAWGAVLSIQIEMADFKPLDTWIAVLEQLGQRYPTFPMEVVELRYVQAMFSSLVYRNPGHPDIRTWAERAFSLAGRTENFQYKTQVMGFLAFYYDYVGEFEKALLAIQVTKGLIRSRQSIPSVQLIFLALESTHLLQSGYPEKCLSVVEEALELFEASGIRMLKVSTLLNGIVAAFNLNDKVRVDQWIQEMEGSLDHTRSWDLTCYHSVKVFQGMLRKDPASVLDQARKASDLIRKNGVSIIAGLCSAHYAVLMHGLGKDLEATALVAEALVFGRKIKAVPTIQIAFLILALIAFDRGQEAKGRACLRRAFALGRKGDFFANWGIHPDDLSRLCSKALEYDIEVEYVREFIRRYQLKPAGRTVPPEHWPWALKVRVLGDFIVYRDGEILRFPRKAQKRPLDLLQALIAAGRKGLREEDLADALWPEADGDASLQSLKITLHRLRTLVGREEAVRVREGRVTLDESFCWIDAWTFERLLEEVESRDSHPAAVSLLEKAVGLYQGFFLGREMEEPWLLAAGERLRSRFLRGVDNLGSLRSRNGEWEKARECYLKGLEVDGLAEAFCQGAMTCCRHLGLRAEGLSLYRRFERRLKTELGIDPAVRTRAIRDSLLGEEG